MKRKFLLSFTISFIFFCSVFMIFSKYFNPSEGNKSSDITTLASNDSSDKKAQEKIIDSDEALILICVVDSNDIADKGVRTDTMMLVNVKFSTGDITILSIPRDTRVEINNRIVKINSAHSIGGMAQTLSSVNDLLGVSIKDYFKLDYQIVIDLVDIIGGVEVEVPFLMEYKDPTAEPPLDIYIKPGLQVLDGKNAHDFLRWRKNNNLTVSYPEGDIGRIKTQQYFMKELINQTLNSEKLILKLPSIVTTYFDNIETNLSLNNILGFTKLSNKFDTSRIVTKTLPGEGKTINEISYFIHDENEVKNLVDKWYK